jgi:hypothetical protein
MRTDLPFGLGFRGLGVSNQHDPRRRDRPHRIVVLVLLVAVLTFSLVRTDWAHARLDSLMSTVDGLTNSEPQPRPTEGLWLTRLVHTDFDSLLDGPISAGAFDASLGGSDWSAATYDDTSVVPDSRGGKAMRVTLDAGTIRTAPSGNNGIVVIVPLRRVVQNACLSYDVKFDDHFDWSMGGKLPGLIGVAPGVSPSLPAGGHPAGDLGWSARPMWLGPGASSAPDPGNVIASYVYSPHQKDRYGDDVWWNASFTRGDWLTVKQCYTMNTVGKADGVLRAWLDGRLAVHLTDYVYRTRPDVGVSHLAWSVFRGGQTPDWASPQTDTIDFDNVSVTTGSTPAD